jgi:hypothetical protein
MARERRFLNWSYLAIPLLYGASFGLYLTQYVPQLPPLGAEGTDLYGYDSIASVRIMGKLVMLEVAVGFVLLLPLPHPAGPIRWCLLLASHLVWALILMITVMHSGVLVFLHVFAFGVLCVAYLVGGAVKAVVYLRDRAAERD